MSAIADKLVDLYNYMNFEQSDPRTHNWLFMNTPFYIVGILTFYFYFINRLGPSLMTNRQPMKLERIMQIYDVVQIVLNVYIFHQALILGWLNHYSFACEPVDYSDDPRAVAIARAVHLYFIVKVLDLIDTFFFVLRKKDNQISFLHVYHHAGMVLGTWAAVKYFAGGHVTFLGLVNSFVHMVMYTHYLVMSFKVKNPWWKKYITQMQLFQFVLILFHFAQLLFRESCGFPLWPVVVFIPQNLFMIILFGEFYYKAYIKAPKREEERNGTDSSKDKQKAH